MESLHHRHATASTRRSPAAAETFTAWRPTRAQPPRRTRPGCWRPRIAILREVRGAADPRGFRRSVPRANTRALHPEPRLLSGRDEGNSGIRHSCAHMRSRARRLNPLARGCLMPPDGNCRRGHGCARVRASNTGTVPQALTATVVRAPEHRARTSRTKSPAHASADLASVDSPSRSSANARGVTVDSICTIATRDSHHHRVSCPCAKYHRVLTRHRAALRFREDFAT